MMSNLRTASLGVVAAIGIALPAISHAQLSAGWYGSVGVFSSQINDANGTSTGTTSFIAPDVVTPGDPGLGGGLLGSGGLLPLPGADALADLLDIVGGILGAGGTDPTVAPGEPFDVPLDPVPIGLRFDGGFGIQTAIGYQFVGGMRPEIILGFSTNDFTSFTGSGDPDDSRDNVSGKLEATRIGANLWFDIPVTDRVLPYAGAGFGYQNAKTTFDSTGSESDSNTYFQAGAGIGVVINPRTLVSLDYRYLVSNDIRSSSFIPDNEPRDPDMLSVTGVRLDDHYEHQAHHIGLSLRYIFAEANIRDSDGDGVPDHLDRCPNTPAGVQVDRFGCPLDSDGDGVPDHLDQCPNTPPGVQVDNKGCPLDSDGDGVPDYLDQCPNTPAGTQVDARGCPLDLRDSDGDGIPDLFDNCPESPAGAPVDENGCPLDSDGDGIADYLDECPNTPPGLAVLPNGCALEGDCRRPRPGEAVDERGCAVDKNFILRGVKFEFDSAILTQEAKKILDRVSETLLAYPNVNVELGGHTDSIGSASYNLGLSERRSIAVKEYLTSKRIPADRMIPVGYGVSRPIADNSTEEGREENRRVELSVRD